MTPRWGSVDALTVAPPGELPRHPERAGAHEGAPVLDHVNPFGERPVPAGRLSDGALDWDSTTLVLVHVYSGSDTGIGYTYSHLAAATLI